MCYEPKKDRFYEAGELHKYHFSKKPKNPIMHDIVENFVMEYSNILEATIGAAFLHNYGDWNETIKITESLFDHKDNIGFPTYSDMKTFNSETWNAKDYSRVLRFHYKVDFEKKSDFIYYKGFIQTLEVRRVKFKRNHTYRPLRFFKDIQAYFNLANSCYERMQQESGKPLTPYEFILFNQKFRKMYKLNMTLEEALKCMMPEESIEIIPDEEEKKESLNNSQ